MMSNVAVVIIGRNEGARLEACLASLRNQGLRLVYVDSGSTDGSIQVAKSVDAEVVELDQSVPFTAARARNDGYRALRSQGAAPEFVQFVDGDCTVEPGWIMAAHNMLINQPDIGIVTGWRSEIHPDASVYNGLCDYEWHRPAGDILGCGGDMMVRASIFEEVGGLNPRIIAAEDEEFCTRVRKKGYRVHRLPLPMTRHDAGMLEFGQWWRRAVRTGHGFAQVGALHPEYFARERQRVWVFAAILPALAIAAPALSFWVLPLVISIYLLSYLRTIAGLRRNGLDIRKAWHQSLFISLSKFPNLMGMLKYYWRMFRGHDMRIIEYK